MKSKNESNKLAKECIVTALIELMKVHDFHSITITDYTFLFAALGSAFLADFSAIRAAFAAATTSSMVASALP